MFLIFQFLTGEWIENHVPWCGGIRRLENIGDDYRGLRVNV